MLRKLISVDKLISLLMVFSILLVSFEYLSHTNFVSNNLGIDYMDFFVIATALLLIRLVLVSKLNFLKYWKKIIFFLPIILTTFLLIIFMKKFHLYLQFEAEDSLFESLQIILLFSSSVISAILAKFFWAKQRMLSILFVLLAIGFFLVAGEEISWGQRIFNIETPEEYAKVNTQGEITIHNYGPIFEYVYKGYALIGLIGSTAWMLKKFLISEVGPKFKKVFEVLIPEWQYFFYFLLTFLYNLEVHILNPRAGLHTGNALWEEPTELLLFFGITLFLIETLLKRKKYV